jgi:succinate dehydrogenase hydrophobic anchor subunit
MRISLEDQIRREKMERAPPMVVVVVCFVLLGWGWWDGARSTRWRGRREVVWMVMLLLLLLLELSMFGVWAFLRSRDGCWRVDDLFAGSGWWKVFFW